MRGEDLRTAIERKMPLIFSAAHYIFCLVYPSYEKINWPHRLDSCTLPMKITFAGYAMVQLIYPTFHNSVNNCICEAPKKEEMQLLKKYTGYEM